MLLLAASVGWLLAGWPPGAAAEPEQSVTLAEELASQLIYFRDERTNLCFAYMWGKYPQSQHEQVAAYGGPGLTEVKCTPEVRVLIGH
jgi:hypothetical protein